ncbi:hypothetical protein [Promicromonospora xylanilytica]
MNEPENQSADPASSADSPMTAAGPDGGGLARRGPRRAVRRGTEREAVLGVSADERPAGWGDGAASDAGHDSNDEQLRRDVPPHWG